MKKRAALFLAIIVALTVALGMIMLAGATDSTDPLDITCGEGMTFDGLSLYHTAKDNPVTHRLTTYEAWLLLPVGYTEDAGSILGNYKGTDLGAVRLRVREGGYVTLFYANGGDYVSMSLKDVCVATGAWTHLTVVDDVDNGEIRCYVNGSLAQTYNMDAKEKAFSRDVSGMPMCLGGSFEAGTGYFKGGLRSVAVYSDVRNEEEILEDYYSFDLDDPELVMAYYLDSEADDLSVVTDLAGNYDVYNNRMNSDWAEPQYVAQPEGYDYSIALLGDTQIMSRNYPKEFERIFDWLIANRFDHKIAHVLNVGDFTNDNTDKEWTIVRDQYFRLNGKIDYTLVRGDHDVLDNDDSDKERNVEMYDNYFNVPAYTDRYNTSGEEGGFYKADGTISDSWRTVTVGSKGIKYLIVTIDKFTGFDDEKAVWLSDILTAHPDHKAIITTHAFVGPEGELVDDSQIKGTKIWECVKAHSNVEMVICGHMYAYGVLWTKSEGDNGNVVNRILTNPQGPDFDREGGTGMIAMLYFDESGENAQVRFYSPVIDKYFVGNNNGYSEAPEYKINTSHYTVSLNDMSAPEAVAPIAADNYIDTDATVGVFHQAYENGATVSLYAQSEYNVDGGRVTLLFDPAQLAFRETLSDVDVEYDNANGYVTVTWTDGLYVSDMCSIATLEFDRYTDERAAAEVGLNVLYLSGKDENGNEFFHKGIKVLGGAVTQTDEVVINYAEGDDFIEKMNEAAELSKYVNVKLVMDADFKAEKNLTFGKLDEPVSGTITVTSKNDEDLSELHTGGFNLILAGYWEFENVKISGNGSGAANSLFFPNGSGCWIGTNVKAGASTANVTGAYLEIYSGEYYYVGAVIDDSVGITVADPTIIFGGDAVADCVCGGARLSGDVYGTANVSILDSASVTRYATPSGYASYGKHDGYMYVNTTGTIGRLCGALGPVGSKGYEPIFVVEIDNVKCTTDSGIMGIRSIVKNSKSYANTDITVNGGQFTKPCYGSLYVGSTYSGVTNYGYNRVTINGGSFGTVFGGGYFAGENTVNNAYCELYINGGSISGTVYGGSSVGDMIKSVYYGQGSDQAGTTYLAITGGELSGSTQVFGSSLLYCPKAKNTGSAMFDVFGGVTLPNYVTGGAKHWYNGTGYASDGGDGTLMSGDVYFNIFDKDIEGNAATVKMNGSRLFAAGYGNSSYAYSEMSGDTYYSYAGITLPTTAYGGFRAQGKYTKLSGDVYGSLENLTISGSYYGGSELVGEYSADSCDIYTTLNNVDVTGTVVGAGKISKATQNFDGQSKVEYVSGTVSGNVVAGSMFTVPNVKITCNSILLFGSESSSPKVTSGGKLIGGCIASSNVFSAAGTAAEWGMYGSSEVVFESGTAEAGAYLVGGSYVKGTVASTSKVNWEKYPVVGGVPGENNTNTTKLTINSGTVNGPNIYAGSYLSAGGQDHGTVTLEMNGGKIVMTEAGITNYGSVATKCLYPATYYPTNTKSIECNYILSLMGGTTDFPAGIIGFSGTFDGYNGTVKGNIELNIAIGTRTKDVTGRVMRVTAGLNNPAEDALLIGNSTLNIFDGAELGPTNPVTAGCYASVAKADTDSNDGIKNGFYQIGDATMNMYGGSINRTTSVSGYGANLDGSVYINIYDGAVTRDIYGMGGGTSATECASVSGDVVWNVTGGSFSNNYGVYASGNAKKNFTNNEGYNVIGGDLYFEASNATFSGIFSLGGLNGVPADGRAYLRIIGDNVTFANGIYAEGKTTSEESEFSLASSSNYTVDLFRTTADYDIYGFGNVFTGENIEITLTENEAYPGTDLSTLIPEKVKINGKEYDYIEVIAFDGYSDYENIIKFYTDSSLKDAVTEMPENAGKLYLTLADVPVGEANVKSSFRISSAALALHHDLSIIFKADMDLFEAGLGYTDAYLTVTMNGNTVDLEPTADDVSGKYNFLFENIAPHMMGDEITVVLHALKDGTPVESAELTYSVLTYCKNKLANSDNAELKTLLADLLNYGAAAQEYVGYKTDALVNKGITGGSTALDLDKYNEDANGEFETVENAVVYLKGAKLVLEDSVTVRFNMMVEEVTDLNGKLVQIYTADESVKRVHRAAELTEYTPENAEEGMTYYYVDFDGLNAAQMGEKVYIKVVDSDGNAVSNTAQYSIGAYAYAKQNDGDAKLSALVKAMIKYGVSAEKIA